MLRWKLVLYIFVVIVGTPWLRAQIQGAPPCGQQLSSGSVYRGVIALSNGGDQGTDIDCDTSNQGTPPWPACTIGEDNQLTSCSYGELYQCVQYVRRFYSLRNDTSDRVNTTRWKGLNAIDYLKIASDGTVTTPLVEFTAFPNSGDYPPMPDDIIVFSEGQRGYGHVAIVTSVTSTNVNIIEENWSKTGLWSLPFDPATNTVGSRQGKKKVYKVVGWIQENQNITGNPVPSIASLSPSLLTVGSPTQPLNIGGSGFLNTSTVMFNGIPHTTQYISGTVLSIQLSAGDLGTTGSFPVIVTNPPPGGGASNIVRFIVGNPVPAITSLVPPSLPAGSSPQTLTVNGTGFVDSSTASFNGQSRATTFVSSTKLSIQLTSTDLATLGSYPVYVTNPAPLGGISNTAEFTVTAQSEVTISPLAVTVLEAGLQTFSATVSVGGGVTWSVQEGPLGGTITSIGIYTPPNFTGVFHVLATSIQDPSQYATATVTVTSELTVNVLHAFTGSDGIFPTGANPQGALAQTVDRYFVGTTASGGNYDQNCYGCGTAFKIDTGGNLTPLHLFDGSDGSQPLSGVEPFRDGLFYGTTSNGGASSACENGCGTLFRIDSSGSLAILHSFVSSDGARPWGAVVQGVDGYIYGTTEYGPPAGSGFCSSEAPGCGTVFKADTFGNITLLHVFDHDDGFLPQVGLVQDSNGNFYGTTASGGAFGYSGTLFSIDSEGAFNLLHSFNHADGDSPNGLLLGADSHLYGTTTGGGLYPCGGNGCGVIFRSDLVGNISVLHNFSGADGSSPISTLIQGPDGYFYGTTAAGGNSDAGVIFKMDSAGNVTVLHSFNGADGQSPLSPLFIGEDGHFYGSTTWGGSNGAGEIFQFDDATAGSHRISVITGKTVAAALRKSLKASHSLSSRIQFEH